MARSPHQPDSGDHPGFGTRFLRDDGNGGNCGDVTDCLRIFGYPKMTVEIEEQNDDKPLDLGVPYFQTKPCPWICYVFHGINPRDTNS